MKEVRKSCIKIEGEIKYFNTATREPATIEVRDYYHKNDVDEAIKYLFPKHIILRKDIRVTPGIMKMPIETFVTLADAGSSELSISRTLTEYTYDVYNKNEDEGVEYEQVKTFKKGKYGIFSDIASEETKLLKKNLHDFFSKGEFKCEEVNEVEKD